MIGLNIIFLPEVDSTNNYIAKLISEGNIQHGTVILAEKQTNGRGQRGNTWQSSAKSQFTASIYLSTAFLSVQHSVYLNKALVLGVVKTISALTDQSAKVKWPNDILVNDLKLGGILIEGNIKNQTLEYVIFGLGINLEQEENLPSSNSFEKIGQKIGAFELLTSLLPRINEEFERCKQGDFSGIQKDYLASLWRINESQTILDKAGIEFSGKIVDVNEEGNVLIETIEGVKSFGLQEVRFVY